MDERDGSSGERGASAPSDQPEAPASPGQDEREDTTIPTPDRYVDNPNPNPDPNPTTTIVAGGGAGAPTEAR
jgi:hypothetical protein